jgi:DNA-binding NarL/FixJ family response regulator
LRVLIVDDEPIYREGLRAVFTRTADIQIVGEAATARAAFPLLDLAPDVVLLDLLMPGLDGISATREIRQRSQGTQVLILTGSRSARDLQDAIGAGAAGYVVKTDPVERLLEAVRMVNTGRQVLPSQVHRPTPRTRGADPDRQDLLDSLSPREREVFRLIVRGYSTARIARELCVSPKTVDTHRQRIYEKFDFHSGVDVIRFAALNGLLPDDRTRDGRSAPTDLNGVEPS